MTTATTWNIAQLERHTADGIVYAVHYTVDANDGTYSANAYGSVGLEPPDPDSIIPYEDLTEEIVVDWVKEKFSETPEAESQKTQLQQIEEGLAAQIEAKKYPTTASGLPWNG